MRRGFGITDERMSEKEKNETILLAQTFWDPSIVLETHIGEFLFRT